MKKERMERLFFLGLFLALLLFEILIGMFVHDRFIRPYVGDVLVVILLYAMVRSVFLHKPTYLSLWIFLFALFVEATQLIPLVNLLGIHNKVLRVIMGTSFAWGDIIAYAAGTVVNFLFDIMRELCYTTKA